jgi:glycosyltransferase involved in cell wall biosynthesis
MLSVGNLVTSKNHNLVIEAAAQIPDALLLIIGQGPEQPRLRKMIAELGLEKRVRILGNMDQATLRDYYGAADALVLASEREGWANVLLESMACGSPVVATTVGAAPDIVALPQAGVLAAGCNTGALLAAIRQLRENYPDRADTRAYAERFSWDETSVGQLRIFNRIIRDYPA